MANAEVGDDVYGDEARARAFSFWGAVDSGLWLAVGLQCQSSSRRRAHCLDSSGNHGPSPGGMTGGMGEPVRCLLVFDRRKTLLK